MCWLDRRDPNKPLIRLYGVPMDAFKQDYAEEPLMDGEELASEPATPIAGDDD